MQGCFIYHHPFSVQIRICNSVNCAMNIYAGLSVFRIQRTMSIFSHNVTLTYVCLYNFVLLWIKINKWIYYKIGNMGRAMGPLQSVYSSQTWLIIRMTLKAIKRKNFYLYLVENYKRTEGIFLFQPPIPTMCKIARKFREGIQSSLFLISKTALG